MLVLLLKALQTGERWITVHPNGDEEKGQPILVSEQKDGSYKVVGGAGGSLNHLRLTGIKPKEEYADSIREKAKARREGRAKQKALDKVLGIEQSKKKAREEISGQQRQEGREFVAGVGKAMGWKPEDYQFDETKYLNRTEADRTQLRRAHEAAMLKRAAEAVELNRQRILTDADARAEAEMGEVPLSTQDDNVLSVQDLDRSKGESAGLGFTTNYKGRAEAAGLTEQGLKSEAETIKKPRTDEQRKAAIARGETQKMVQENLDILRDPSKADEKLKARLVDAKQAVELMKLDKKRRMADREAQKARKKIDTAVTEPKAYVLEVGNAGVDAKVSEEVSTELRTIATRAFLSEVRKTADNPQQALGRHIGVGAFNSINALALAAGGAALVDRSVVDVLGVGGAAEVLARRLQSDLTPDEMKRVTDGMEEFHLHNYMQESEEALASARELQDAAKEIELGEAEKGGDLAVMQELNNRRLEAIGEAQRILGTAWGEMEANAALVFALKRGKSSKDFQVSLGQVSPEDAIQQVRAIGLKPGSDYTLETAAGNRILTVTPEGMARLAKPVNRADLEQVRRNLDIIRGKDDEDGWLPGGISDRPDLDMQVKPGIAPTLAQPFDPKGQDLRTAIRDYIGGRMADGDTPADIVADMQSADYVGKVGDRSAEYFDLLNEMAPLKDQKGKMQTAESLRPAFEAMADEYVSARFGADRAPLHRQTFAVDETSIDALHRALAAEPAGVAAYKPIGEMDSHDQRAMREFFYHNVAHESPEAASLRRELEHVDATAPDEFMPGTTDEWKAWNSEGKKLKAEADAAKAGGNQQAYEAADKAFKEHVAKEPGDVFSGMGENPEYGEWRTKRDELATKVNASSLDWPKYVQAMHGNEQAYAALQDMIRSKVAKSFADAHNRLKPGAPLKVGRALIRNNLNHLDAVDPAKREERLAQEQSLIDSLRNRVAGKYASGSVRDKLDAKREEEAGFEAAQMGFFASDGDVSEPAEPADKPLAPDERYTLGHEAERQIAKMMPQVGQNFEAGQPLKLFRPTMSGGKNFPRQRAVKMIEANKRVALSFGVGTGKTLISLAGYTHLQQQGKVKRGLFLVPSIVQGQFGGEALRFLKPGTFNWHAQPGASRAERIAAYKDPKHNFCVMTHQSFRDDMLHLGAEQAGISSGQMSAQVDGMSRGERKAWLKGVMDKEGINFDYLTVDEGHNTLNRKGKENSALANVIDAASDNTPYYVNASGDPIKNDVSEAFSLLQKMDPDRYTDEAAFTRKYGVDTIAAKDELRREMARFQYPSKIDPDVVATKSERSVGVSDGQRKALADLDSHLAEARMARMRGKVDVAAIKAISPDSFANVPEDKQEAVAGELQKAIGVLKSSAVRRILDASPDSAKLDEVVKVAKERNGKPGVVFAHSLEAVRNIRARLEKEGLRVVDITGKDSAKDKEHKRRMFHPDSGEPEADILVASDAGATGMNAQRGQWLVQYDTPMTAMTHAQRQGRINRTGQKNNVELIDLVSDHPEERRARERLKNKYALRELMTTPMESLDDTGVAYYLRQRGSRDATVGGSLL